VPEGLINLAFRPLSGKLKRINSLRAQRLCGENEFKNQDIFIPVRTP
jgi:hypothetical protein